MSYTYYCPQCHSRQLFTLEQATLDFKCVTCGAPYQSRLARTIENTIAIVIMVILAVAMSFMAGTQDGSHSARPQKDGSSLNR